ncbi:GyrI-like domain-containing protein [Pseudooceanicola onchidii]|uniref:GyrI-like domain-containing protein n=1 Tax=Pseudooceanicola onchidii TaxID=2562279 RepID=UPI0010AAF8F0|nr:GyrI-like domain-containing protein [Pseudooceanicola onchidii]
MTKLDVKKSGKALYSGRNGVWEEITVPPMLYLTATGRGDPDGPAFAAATQALYAHAYPLKFAAKDAGRDHVVPPLEAQWWADDPRAFTTARRADWQWKAMLRLPVPVTEAMIAAARAKAAAKLGADAPDVSIEEIAEGLCLQCLHIGPYADEAPVLAQLHDRIMPERGLTFGLPHHEIYLSDPRRTDPAKLRTILRQPVVPLT